jgi:hypothetical protein
VILFNKLKQTVAALKRNVVEPMPHEKAEAYGLEFHRSASNEKPVRIVRTGVVVAIVIPSAFLLTAILHQLTSLTGKNLGALSILVGFGLGYAINKLENVFVERVPFHKLNPFFGSKLEETIAALRKHS